MANKQPTSLKNKLLVATPLLRDPMFHHAVAYIFEENDEGNMGIVINKPTDISIAGILEHLDIPVEDPNIMELPVMRGGPVAREHGFIIHREHDIGHGEIADPKNHIIISASKEDLITIPQAAYDHIIVSLGYSGWEKGQLWDEIQENAWLVAPLDLSILFDVPIEQRWQAAAALIGVDFSKFVNDIGHG